MNFEISKPLDSGTSIRIVLFQMGGLPFAIINPYYQEVANVLREHADKTFGVCYILTYVQPVSFDFKAVLMSNMSK